MTEQKQIDYLAPFLTENKKVGFLSKVQNFLLLVAIFILIIPIFFWAESVLIHFDKPLVLISGDVFIYLISAILFIFWVIYTFASKLLLSEYLTWVHVIITLGIIFFFLITSSWFLKSNASNKVQASIIKVLMINRQHNLRSTSILGIIFIIGQLAFFVNLIGGLASRNSK